MQRGWRKTCLKLRRPVTSAVTLLAYLVAAIGYPMPYVEGAHTCGQRVCECGSEESCRASGCGCRPGGSRAPKKTEQPPAGSCCQRGEDTPNVRSPGSVTNACQAKPCLPEPKFKVAAPIAGATKAPVRWVVGVTALKCQGHATTWVAIAAALPPCPPLSWQPNCPFLHVVPPFQQESFIAVQKPLLPPPRPLA